MKYNKKDEEVVSTLGYPYNVLPKGYPNKLSDEKIEETMEIFLQNLKNNAAVDTIVNREIPFINLGLNELNNRNNRRQSRIAFWLSVLSVIFAGISLVVSFLSYSKELCF